MSNNPIALITGASTGIGRDLAHIFAEHHYDLVVVARSVEKLESLAEKVKNSHGIQVHILPKDLSKPVTPEEIYREISNNGWAVHTLVNNAGLGIYGYFWETDLQQELDILRVNVLALTHLTKLFLKDMISRGSGKILNVASTAAFQPGPLMAVYYASKAYVLHFSEALANELKGKGITVTALCPGPTETPFEEVAKMENSSLWKNLPLMDSRSVAQAGFQGLQKGKTLVIPGLSNKITANLPRISPRGLVTKTVRRIQAKLK